MYRRLGLAGFDSLKKDELLLALGEYPSANNIADVASGFIRNEKGYEEVVIV